ncbi:hypothetical protein Trydic_g18932 [Trypoxylus dichotomus]
MDAATVLFARTSAWGYEHSLRFLASHIIRPYTPSGTSRSRYIAPNASYIISGELSWLPPPLLLSLLPPPSAKLATSQMLSNHEFSHADEQRNFCTPPKYLLNVFRLFSN